jgi:hypothetical protein
MLETNSLGSESEQREGVEPSELTQANENSSTVKDLRQVVQTMKPNTNLSANAPTNRQVAETAKAKATKRLHDYQKKV